MKKVRNKSKAGFTLLEVLLAVVILVIASTMIMKGFIAVMIFGRNDRNYAKSGEDNYRRAMNETIIHNATAVNQETDVIAPLTGGVHSTLAASFDDLNHVPTGITANQMNLTVDVSVYTDPNVNITTNVGGDDLDALTSTNNRYAFFYDFGDFIGPTTMDDHIYRWGYMFVAKNDYNSRVHVGYVPVYAVDGTTVVGYGLYGFYCFNALHDPATHTCRRQPLSSFGA